MTDMKNNPGYKGILDVCRNMVKVKAEAQDEDQASVAAELIGLLALDLEPQPEGLTWRIADVLHSQLGAAGAAGWLRLVGRTIEAHYTIMIARAQEGDPVARLLDLPMASISHCPIPTGSSDRGGQWTAQAMVGERRFEGRGRTPMEAAQVVLDNAADSGDDDDGKR